LQILQVTSLDLREISYLVANAAGFSDLRLSSLPSQASDDSLANAVNLFAQMYTLFDYADLRKNPAGGSDGLINVFQAVGTIFAEAPASQASNSNPLTPWAALASLTRRNVADVRTIGEYFGLIQDVVAGATENVRAVGDFGNNKGIRRIWQALQLIQIMRIPVTALTACTAIAAPAPPASGPPPDQIATNFKNAVRAQFTIGQWLPVAQSVFDPLRQMKRNALVAYLVNALDLANSNQLFEYFLVDPGMEPVVQTSRLRLAMSSLQTFVQRCLLNLENVNTVNPAVNVAPAAIDPDWWSWMKRYRIWQANRKISGTSGIQANATTVIPDSTLVTMPGGATLAVLTNDGSSINLPAGTSVSLRSGLPLPFFYEGIFSTSQYNPDPDNVQQPYPVKNLDFTTQGPYAIYNWEIFFGSSLSQVKALHA
jgi:hypothetical protein